MSDPIRDLVDEYERPRYWNERVHHVGDKTCTCDGCAESRLIALAPGLARVAPDLADALSRWGICHCEPLKKCARCAALADYQALQERARESVIDIG